MDWSASAQSLVGPKPPWRTECTGYTLHFFDAGLGKNGSDKFYTAFWFVNTLGTYSVILYYGRDGTTGQFKVVNYADVAAAQKLLDKKMAEKVRHGYEKLGEGVIGCDISQDTRIVAEHFKTMVAQRPADKSRMSGGYLIHEEPDLMDLLS